VNGH